jgi:hypothetical protein
VPALLTAIATTKVRETRIEDRQCERISVPLGRRTVFSCSLFDDEPSTGLSVVDSLVAAIETVDSRVTGSSSVIRTPKGPDMEADSRDKRQ